MKTCEACRKQIDVRATKCPFCQTNFDGAQMERGRKEHGRRRLISAGAALVLILLLTLSLLRWLSRPGVVEEMGRIDAEREMSRE